MNSTGYNIQQITETKTFLSRFNAFRDRYRIQFSATLAVIASITFVVATIIPIVQKYVSDSGLLQYLTVIIVLDLAVTIYRQQRPENTTLIKNQDDSMPKLIEVVEHCKTDGVDLLEYAGATALPLIRAIQRNGVPFRLLVKHPNTVSGIQKQRMITTLDTLYNSIFDNCEGTFEIRCYKLPYTLRGRRLGRELLELGWLTPDIKRVTAFGHANPSVLADLSIKSNDYLYHFFNKTFLDYWEDKNTEDGNVVLTKLLSGTKKVRHK